MCVVSCQFYSNFDIIFVSNINFVQQFGHFGSFSRHVGRRKFLICSGLGMGVCILAAAIFMFFEQKSAVETTVWYTIHLICVLGYVCCSSLGVLVIPWWVFLIDTHFITCLLFNKCHRWIAGHSLANFYQRKWVEIHVNSQFPRKKKSILFIIISFYVLALV